jgi:DNA-binding CsgD family transcriptional regulator
MMDWIGLIEPIYDLETPSHDAWLTNLTAAIAPAMSATKHAVAGIFHLEGTLLQMFASSDDATAYAAHSQALDSIDPGIIVGCFGSVPFNTMSANIGKRRLERAHRLAHRAKRTTFSEPDALGLLARDGGAWGVCICAACPIHAVARRESVPWERVAAHIHAALRLRFRVHGVPSLGAAAPGLNLKVGIDAIVSPNGKVEHAEPDAQAYLESLKQAAVAIDRARARMRREDPEGALEAWRSLVEGQWSLVESFESDGRRYLLARRNAPDAPVAPLLTERERSVLSLRARLHGVKLIAYELGVSQASVSRAMQSGMKKLGVESVGGIAGVMFESETGLGERRK